MFFYVVLTLIVTILVQIARNDKKNKNIWLGLAILIPSVIGGFRDLTIGQDLDGYGTVYFQIAQRYSSYIAFIKDWETKEYAYATLCYLGHWINGDINTYLFISELIKMALIVKTAWHFRDRVNPCLVVFCYMLFMYWYGLSMMRQSLALACCFFSMIFFFDRRYIHFVVCILVAYLFHNSSLVFLYLPLATILYNKVKHPFLISLIAAVGLYTFSVSVFLMLASTGFFKEELVDLYLDSGVESAKSNILFSSFMFVIPIVFYRCRHGYEYWYFLVKLSALLSLMFLFLSSYFEIAFRVSFYMTYVLLLAFPIVISSIKNKKMRNFTYIFYILLFIVHYFANARHGLAETIPYTSKILGF